MTCYSERRDGSHTLMMPSLIRFVLVWWIGVSVAHGADRIDALIAELKSKDWTKIASAVEELKALDPSGQRTIPALKQLLARREDPYQDQDQARAQIAAFQALRSSGLKETEFFDFAFSLITARDHLNLDAYSWCSTLLSEHPEYQPFLESALLDSKSRRRSQAIFILAKAKPKFSKPGLVLDSAIPLIKGGRKVGGEALLLTLDGVVALDVQNPRVGAVLRAALDREYAFLAKQGPQKWQQTGDELLEALIAGEEGHFDQHRGAALARALAHVDPKHPETLKALQKALRVSRSLPPVTGEKDTLMNLVNQVRGKSIKEDPRDAPLFAARREIDRAMTLGWGGPAKDLFEALAAADPSDYPDLIRELAREAPPAYVDEFMKLAVESGNQQLIDAAKKYPGCRDSLRRIVRPDHN